MKSERRDRPTPSGGDYSEVFYFDAKSQVFSSYGKSSTF